jgi:hypothetical protein
MSNSDAKTRARSKTLLHIGGPAEMAHNTPDTGNPLMATIHDLTRDGLLDADGNDRLLAELVELRRVRAETDQRLRYLIAYARELVYPRPYTLADIATAAGLSISGVRTFYTTGDVHTVADAIAEKNIPPKDST